MPTSDQSKDSLQLDDKRGYFDNDGVKLLADSVSAYFIAVTTALPPHLHGYASGLVDTFARSAFLQMVADGALRARPGASQ